MRHTGPALATAVALVALSLVAVGACGGSDGGGGVSPPPSGAAVSPPPPGAADISGSLSRLAVASDGTVSFLVVADPDATGDYGRAVVRTTTGTTVWAPVGADRRRLTAGDLRDGLRVAVRFEGPVAESYPVQAVAADIEVVSVF